MMTKEAVNRASETSLSEEILFERRIFHSTFATQDQKEGMAAFIEKRSPSFHDADPSGKIRTLRTSGAGKPGMATARRALTPMRSVGTSKRANPQPPYLNLGQCLGFIAAAPTTSPAKNGRNEGVKGVRIRVEDEHAHSPSRPRARRVPSSAQPRRPATPAAASLFGTSGIDFADEGTLGGHRDHESLVAK